MAPSDGSGGADGSTANGNGELSSPLSVVCSYWLQFDLEGMRGKLDEIGLKVAEHQEEAMQNRKKLADSTREFKRSAPEAISRGVGPLLKQYQEEVDKLTRRAKHGENAFLELYQKLYEAPDPAPALAMAAETASRAADLEAQVRKMSTELAEFRTESAAIKNQDLTIRKLEERVRGLEAALEEREAQLAGASERAAAQAESARLEAMQEREAALAEELAAAHASMAALQRLHAATQGQLFAMQSQGEEERYGRQSELELASAELDRAQERLGALEREKASLVQQLHSNARGSADSNGGAPTAAGGHSSGVHGGTGYGASNGGAGVYGSHAHSQAVEEGLRSELSAQRELCAKLRADGAALRRDLEQAHAMWEARVDGLRASLAATEQHAVALEEQLSVRPTNAQVDELRAQLRVLQAIGYNTLTTDHDGSSNSNPAVMGPDGVMQPGADGGDAGSSGYGGSSSLEALLLGKNRHLEHELTMTRLSVVDLRQEVDTATARVAELEAQVEDRQALINKLEEDLVASRGAAANNAGDGSDSDKVTGASEDLKSGSGRGAGDGDTSMVRVLCSQRDRFRAKAQELEEEVTRARAELAAARNESAAARADNMALVERLRYVHGFKASSGRRDAGSDLEAGIAVERKYGALYDDGQNPFREFQGQQKERTRKAMNVPDKIMYMFGQLVFGSQAARLFTFCYLAIMHLLVFTSLARMTHHSSSHLIEHQQHVLDHRHSATALLQHENETGHSVAAMAAAVKTAVNATVGSGFNQTSSAAGVSTG